MTNLLSEDDHTLMTLGYRMTLNFDSFEVTTGLLERLNIRSGNCQSLELGSDICLKKVDDMITSHTCLAISNIFSSSASSSKPASRL